MEGADESTELWRLPVFYVKSNKVTNVLMHFAKQKFV